MKIDDALIAYLEELSCLTLPDGERQMLKGELELILNNIAELDGLDTTGVPERSHPFDNANAFRNDEARASTDRELILKNAPNRSADAFIAPKTVE